MIWSVVFSFSLLFMAYVLLDAATIWVLWTHVNQAIEIVALGDRSLPEGGRADSAPWNAADPKNLAISRT
jgi:hypothetical protein